MICAVLVIVPGDGVAWSQCKNPCQDIAAFQHRLDVFDFVRIGCGHNDVLPITFKQIAASTSPPLALPYGDVRFGSKAQQIMTYSIISALSDVHRPLQIGVGRWGGDG
jgi:hypothetical protein